MFIVTFLLIVLTIIVKYCFIPYYSFLNVPKMENNLFEKDEIVGQQTKIV